MMMMMTMMTTTTNSKKTDTQCSRNIRQLSYITDQQRLSLNIIKTMRALTTVYSYDRRDDSIWQATCT